MSTTALYIELVIIGTQTITWLVLIIDTIKQDFLSKLFALTENIVVAVLLVGIAYVVGIVFDRVANWVFQSKEDRIKKEEGFEGKSSILVEENTKMQNHQIYNRSKYRILRSSSINIPIIALTLIINLSINSNLECPILIFIFVLGVGLTTLTCLSTGITLKNFYNKAKLIKDYNESKKAKHIDNES